MGFGAETINFEEENAVDTILDLTGGIGTDRASDAVGIAAYRMFDEHKAGWLKVELMP